MIVVHTSSLLASGCYHGVACLFLYHHYHHLLGQCPILSDYDKMHQTISPLLGGVSIPEALLHG